MTVTHRAYYSFPVVSFHLETNLVAPVAGPHKQIIFHEVAALRLQVIAAWSFICTATLYHIFCVFDVTSAAYICDLWIRRHSL